MSFSRHGGYADTAVQWLGPIPSHWTLPPLYTRYEVLLGKMLDTKRITGEHLVPYLRNVDVQWDRVNVDDLPRFDVLPEERERYTLQAGDLLVCEGGEVGRTAIWRGELDVCSYQKALHRVRPLTADELPRYLYYCMCFAGSQGAFLAGGNPNTIPHLTAEKLRLYRLPKPPAHEQLLICGFLDSETAKIDTLIEEQRRLIDLLNEKRQAVISHAVTKGLSPDAPMKPSGVEWLGDVPAHWSVSPIKRDLKFITSGSRGWASNYSDEGSLFIRIANLTRQGINLDLSDVQRVTVPPGTEGLRTKVESGDLLFSITAYLGSVAVVPPDLGPAYVSQHVALGRLSGQILTPKWVAYSALSTVGRSWFDRAGYGGTKIQLSLDDVRDMVVPIPAKTEQHHITLALEEELEQMDKLIAEAGAAIDLLQERRTALISAAVTGQIDVRGLAPAPSNIAAGPMEVA